MVRDKKWRGNKEWKWQSFQGKVDDDVIHAAFFYIQVGINYKIIGSIPILLV